MTVPGARRPERDYSHRDIVDKLGVKSGHAVAFDPSTAPPDPDLRARILSRAGRAESADDEPLDLCFAAVDATTDADALLAAWKPRLKPAGSVWLLSPRRGQPGYVDQRHLIAAGPEAGLVNSKSCSVSDTVSGLRFVIRRSER